MQITRRDRSGVLILQPRGKLTLGVGEAAFSAAVHAALDQGSSRLLIDCRELAAIDSVGVGVLAAAGTSARRRDGALKLLNLSPKVEDILQITQLYRTFEIFDSEDQAITSFL